MERSTTEVDPSSANAERASDGKAMAWTVTVGGFLACAGGLLLAAGPAYSPELSWIARRFGEMGISSGAVIGSGLVCGALGMVLNRLSRVGGQMRSAEDGLKVTETISISMRQLVARMTRLHAETAEFKEGLNGLLRLAQEQSSTKVAGMQVDATYRLAASMDQMCMRLEDRMRAQESTFDSRLMDLYGSLSAAHQQIQSLLNQREDQSFDSNDLLDAGHIEFDADIDAQPRLPEEPADNELEVFVDLEEEFEPDPEAEVPHVSEFDWDSIEIEPTIEGLGLLDELDDEGVPVDAAAPPPSPSNLERAPSLLPFDDSASDKRFSEEALEKAWKDFKRRRDDS